MTPGMPVLIIDDEEALRDSMGQVLAKEGYAVREAACGRDGLTAFGGETLGAVFLDLRLPDVDGLKILSQMQEASPETPVIIITGYGSIESAVEAIKRGAFDYLTKPFTPEELRVVTHKAMATRTMILENILLRRELRIARDFDRIIGVSKAIRRVLEVIAQAAPSDSAVLITGESGTGKELVAREIHARSLRQAAPFVALDCSALAEPFLEADLLGQAKGARPGSPEARHGRLELAQGGTMFLDEVSHLSPRLQSDLVRVIETREVRRLGGTRPLAVDVRLVAAASVNLVQAVSQGSFRQDLYYRLSVVPIHLPPLRERKEDIPLLVDHFINKYSRKAGKEIRAVSTRAMLVLTEYNWPGNIRELDNTIERAVVLARGREIEVEDLMSHGISMGIPALAWAGGQFKALEAVEKEYIAAVLRDQNGNKGRTAVILGIDRKTLWAKIKKFGLDGRRTP
jgi:two-component system, NtrC family, response regulator HydG